MDGHSHVSRWACSVTAAALFLPEKKDASFHFISFHGILNKVGSSSMYFSVGIIMLEASWNWMGKCRNVEREWVSGGVCVYIFSGPDCSKHGKLIFRIFWIGILGEACNVSARVSCLSATRWGKPLHSAERKMLTPVLTRPKDQWSIFSHRLCLSWWNDSHGGWTKLCSRSWWVHEYAVDYYQIMPRENHILYTQFTNYNNEILIMLHGKNYYKNNECNKIIESLGYKLMLIIIFMKMLNEWMLSFHSALIAARFCFPKLHGDTCDYFIKTAIQ